MNYWQIKAAALEHAIRRARLQDEATACDAAYAAIITANGLDPTKRYQLRDQDESVTEEIPDGTPRSV